MVQLRCQEVTLRRKESAEPSLIDRITLRIRTPNRRQAEELAIGLYGSDYVIHFVIGLSVDDDDERKVMRDL